MEIRLKRVYDPASPDDGARILVDRLWPRGVSKERADLALWLRTIAPSDDLRRWFGHDPSLWTEFLRRYGTELDHNPQDVATLRDWMARGPVTLIYAAHDHRYNNAVALADYLQGEPA
ncbi:MAG: DUF488 domain-containing protein [Paracoccus sp. (in: a-proteobacteria)]|nr:DUF488 domain-containing protein [Paracoccus sp. (in: a-proteobacteria)]